METASATLAPVSDLIAEYRRERQAAEDPAAQEVSKEMFLQLLVAQIRNQNPLNPADGLEFVSQLAEFSTLEQLIAIREGVEALGDVAETVLPEHSTENTSEETAPADGGNPNT